jgi:hypothetical protein
MGFAMHPSYTIKTAPTGNKMPGRFVFIPIPAIKIHFAMNQAENTRSKQDKKIISHLYQSGFEKSTMKAHG